MDTLNFRKNDNVLKWEIFDLTSIPIGSDSKIFGTSQPLENGLLLRFSVKEKLPLDTFLQIGVQLWIETEKRIYGVREIDEDFSDSEETFCYSAKSFIQTAKG